MVSKTALRARERLMKRRAKQGGLAKSDILTPPLKLSTKSKKMVAWHYLKGRHANRNGKVAWVTSGAPIEFLKALDFYLIYPENHGALCGVARVVEDISTEAEDAGFSRDICSYARTDIGSMLSGKTPVGNLPRPDLLLACTNICQTVMHWYRVLAHHFEAPLILIDTPFVYYSEPSDHAVDFVIQQLKEAIPLAERVAGKALEAEKLADVIRLGMQASQLWLDVLERGKNRPAPLSVFDQFTLMAPIVEMRGEQSTVDFYSALLEELDERIEAGIGVVERERRRLLWDNLPVWYKLRYLAEYLGAHGVVVVASTYTNAWAELTPLMDPSSPLESMARTYMYPILNRGAGQKLGTMKRMIEEYHLDGAILHSDRSCKPYSIGQMDQRDQLMREYGLPALLLEADHNDPRAFAEEQIANRLEAFIEMLEV